MGRFAGRQRLGFAAIFASFAILLYHAISYVPNTILLDQWRFVYGTLARYYSGEFSFLDLVANETSHIRIGYRTLFLLNAILFDLNIHVELVVGLAALLGFTLLLYRRYLDSLTVLDTPLGAQLLFLLLLMIVLSPSKNVFFIYSTLCINTFVGWLLYLAFWSSVDTTLRRGENRFAPAVQFGLLVLIVFGFSGDKSPAVIGAALTAIALDLFLKREDRRRRFRYLLRLGTAATLLVVCYVLALRLWAGRSFVSAGVPPVIADPAGAVQYVLTVLASATLHRDILIAASSSLPFAIGAVVLVLYAYGFYLYFRLRLWRETWLPLMLMLYSLGFIAELLQARFGHQFGGPLRASYAGDPQLGMIGVLWVFTRALIGRYRNSARPVVPIACTLLLFAGIVTAQAASIAHVLKAKPGYRLRAERAVAMVKQDPDAPVPSWYCRKGPACNDALKVLRDNRLNIYSE